MTCPHGVMLGGYCYQCQNTTTSVSATSAWNWPATTVTWQPQSWGWTCPGCGYGYAPTVAVCHHCPQQAKPLRCSCPQPDVRDCGTCHTCHLPGDTEQREAS